MKFVLVGNHNSQWTARSAERGARAHAKAQQLGVSVVSSYYTQGRFDFVTVIDSPDAETASRFSIWYAAQGFGTVETLRGFSSAEMEILCRDLLVDETQPSNPAPAQNHLMTAARQALQTHVFGSYTQAELDLEYNPRLSVLNFPEIAQEWASLSRAAREHMDARLDIAYGESAAETLDVFLPENGADAPIHIFFHGGYWRSGDKSDYSFVAESLVGAGAMVVIPNYTLCPTCTMDELLAQCYRAIRWVYDNAGSFKGDRSRIHISGHSAGAHIVTMAMTAGKDHGLPEGLIKSGCAVSGLYNLEPLRRSFLNLEIRLDPQLVLECSPSECIRLTAAPLMLSLGGLESTEFHRQTFDYFASWQGEGNVAKIIPALDTNHYSVLDAFIDPSHPLGKSVIEQLYS